MLGGRGKIRLTSGSIRTMSGEAAHAGFNYLVNLQMRVHRLEVDLGFGNFHAAGAARSSSSNFLA
jgi:hypothetical protein